MVRPWSKPVPCHTMQVLNFLETEVAMRWIGGFVEMPTIDEMAQNRDLVGGHVGKGLAFGLSR